LLNVTISTPHSRSKLWIGLTLGLVTLAFFLPSVTHQFLRYDDQQYVTENQHVQAGLTWATISWAFKSFHATNWHPLTWLSHMLDCQFYGLKPAGHHLTNVLLHTANSVLLFLLLVQLTGALWRSAAVAALFAWHPLHVESVAWIAERKDLLCAFFWMLTLWAYARYVKESRGQSPGGRVQSHPSRFYLLALVLFALALMSKPMAVTLPFVLLLLDYWPLRRFQIGSLKAGSRKLVFLLGEKVPFLILSGVSCALTLLAQEQAMVSTAGLGISQRFGHAPVAYAHYLGAMLVPRHLAIYYPYDKTIPGGEIVLAVALLTLITTAVLWFCRRLPYLATGWLWFLGTLVPVIGLVQVGEQAWADRYTYLPYIGLFIALVWGLSDLAARVRAVRTVLPWLAATTSVALLIGTSVQLRYWKDTRTLFEHVDRVTQNNPLSATLLGSLLATEGKYDEAIPFYRRALSYSPGFPEAHFYLGHAFDEQGKLDEAIAEYQKAVWFKPIEEQTHIRLGIALAKQQKLAEAITQYEAAIKVNPESATAHNDLAKLLHSQGQLDDAILHYSAALKFDPSLAQAHNNLGVLLLQKGKASEGIAQLREALRLKPGDAETQLNLAQGLVDQQQWSEAADLFAKTVTASTSDPNIHCRFAVALAHLHKTREAMSQFASALLLQQDLPDALDGLSWILATNPDSQIRNGSEAVRMSERACELTGRKDPEKLKTLAATYAEVGRFQEAATAAQTAADLASQRGQKDLAEECRLIRKSCDAAKPWRVP
jgi:tetratricopeptide (TPR) repeat protein